MGSKLLFKNPWEWERVFQEIFFLLFSSFFCFLLLLMKGRKKWNPGLEYLKKKKIFEESKRIFIPVETRVICVCFLTTHSVLIAQKWERSTNEVDYCLMIPREMDDSPAILSSRGKEDERGRQDFLFSLSAEAPFLSITCLFSFLCLFPFSKNQGGPTSLTRNLDPSLSFKSFLLVLLILWFCLYLFSHSLFFWFPSPLLCHFCFIVSREWLSGRVKKDRYAWDAMKKRLFFQIEWDGKKLKWEDEKKGETHSMSEGGKEKGGKRRVTRRRATQITESMFTSVFCLFLSLSLLLF